MDEMKRYRAGVARLLAKQVTAIDATERRLRATIEGSEASENDPVGYFQAACASLLRKAAMHMTAVARAHTDSNLHSLAVQMRPALECAGQVVLLVHNSVVEPECRESVLIDYVDADYLDTWIRVTKGNLTYKELLDRISDVRRELNEPQGKVRGLDQVDKVKSLNDGKRWYAHLSAYFSHGEADWGGFSWQGGVRSVDTIHDDCSFAVFMDYLVEQAAVMNVYAMLCPVAEEESTERIDAALGQLDEVRESAKELRDRATEAIESQIKRAPLNRCTDE